MKIIDKYFPRYQENGAPSTRIRVQFSFNGVNDIKQRKILEAKKILLESGVRTVLIHLDLYHRQIAFVSLDQIEDNDEHWITRINTKSGLLFNLDQNYFISNLSQLIQNV